MASVQVRAGAIVIGGRQKVTPRLTWYDRGVTKCVPLKVERKL
jgi:hypothetical protein